MNNYYLPKTTHIRTSSTISIQTRLPDEFFPFQNNNEVSHVAKLIEYLKKEYNVNCKYVGVQNGIIYFKQCSPK